MTEGEWLSTRTGIAPWRVTHPMLVFLERIGRAGEHKLRLFAMACYRLLFQKCKFTLGMNTKSTWRNATPTVQPPPTNYGRHTGILLTTGCRSLLLFRVATPSSQ